MKARFFGLVLCMLSGCTTVQYQGAILDLEKFDDIKIGESTPGDVLIQFGNPSFTSQFDSTTWFYTSRVQEKILFFPPSLKEAHTLVFQFSPDGLLEHKDHITQDSMFNITISHNQTSVPEHESSWEETFFKGLKRVTPGPSFLRP